MARVRRGRGEGSIYYWERRGCWCGSLTVGLDAEGGRRRRIVYGPTKREVQQKLARLQSDASRGLLADPTRMRVADFLERWLDDAVRTQVRPTTLAWYRRLGRNHVVPSLGGLQLAGLTPVHVQALLSRLERDGAGPRTRQAVYTLLRQALQQAVRWNLVPRNACEGVARPRVPRTRIRVLDVDEVRLLLEAARGDRLEALYVLAVTTGLRQGELLALRWCDIDLAARTLTVQRNLVQLNGRLEITEPKTAASRRRVDLPCVAVAALEAHRRRRPAAPHPTAFVFADAKGGPIRKQNLVRRSFRPLLGRAGLPRIRFHDLRHTAATLLLAEGVHPKIVAERLGHSSVTITLDIYSHVLKGMQREAADRLDGLLTAGRDGAPRVNAGIAPTSRVPPLH